MSAWITQIFQRLFGVVLVFWFLEGVGVVPFQRPTGPPREQPLVDAVFASGYLIPTVLLVYLLAGIAFLSNRFVALGAVVLFPVSLNILLLHAFLGPRALPLALVLFIPNVLLLWTTRDAFRGLLRP